MNLTIGLIKDFAKRKNAAADTVLKFRFGEWDHQTTGWGFTNEYLNFTNRWGDVDWREADVFVICLWNYRPYDSWFKPFEADRDDGFLNSHTATLEEFLDATQDLKDDVEIVFKSNGRFNEQPAIQIGYSLPFYHANAADVQTESEPTPKELVGTLFEESWKAEHTRVSKSVWNWYDYRPQITICNEWNAVKDFPLDCWGYECFNPEFIKNESLRFWKQRNKPRNEWGQPPEYVESSTTRRILGTASWDDFESYKQEAFLRERDVFKPFIQRSNKWEEALKTEQLKDIRKRNIKK